MHFLYYCLIKSISMALQRLLLAIILFTGNPLSARQPLLRHYTLADGLPSNVIYDVYQDSKGFIWFCTDQGISRFDGNTFRNYSIRDGLPDTEIFRIREDDQHRYWLICFNNKACYLRNGKVYNGTNDTLCRRIEEADIRYDDLFAMPSGYALAGKRMALLHPPGITVRSLTGDERPCRVYYFREGYNEYLVKYTYLYHLNSGRRFQISRSLLEECFYDGSYLFLYTNRAEHFFLEQWQVSDSGARLLKKTAAPSRIHQISPFRPGQLLCCTDKGVFLYSISSGRFARDEAFSDDAHFNRALKDREGNLWVTTLDNGVYFKPKTDATLIDQRSGLHRKNILTLTQASSGGLIAGDDRGNVTRIDRQGIHRLFVEEKDFTNRILFLNDQGRNRLVIGCDAGLFSLDRHSSRRRCLYRNTFKAGLLNGDQFFAGFSGGLLACNIETGTAALLTQQRVTAMAMDNTGVLCLGGTSGLSLYKEGMLQPYRFNHLLRQSRITCMTRNEQGHLFAGTSNNGLFLIRNPEGPPVQLHRAGKGDNVFCKKLFTAKDNQVWLCTEEGLYRLLPGLKGDYTARPVSLPGAITGNKINDFIEVGGKLYLATAEGIVVYNSLDTTGEKPPALYIETVNDSVLSDSRPTVMTFPYKKQNTQISYTAIHFAGKPVILYKYLLLGGAEDTVYTTARTINFNTLSPGTYTLLLWARSTNSAWSFKPASLTLHIQPPWWRHPLFLLTTGLLIAGGIAWAYRAHLRSTSKKAVAAAHNRQQLAELEMKAIKAQINPHFIFNALNAIQSYYSQHSEREANHYMTAFARFIRLTLENSQSHWLPLSEELAMLRIYIELEQMRFKHMFTYRIEMEPGIQPEGIQIPAMLLQPYVENAINHGLRLLQTCKGLLSIRFMLQEEALVCSIEDNGVGISYASGTRTRGHNSFGMRMNSQRIDAMNRMYDLSIKVTVNEPQPSAHPEGTLVALYIPLFNHKNNADNLNYR
ncbi:sensor histidine kinase [Taibaiella koreensis]|uniref:sensor histidine kinase n=1 Tax=Taibaiella koreensis TaxID=1268548 RepID=UPI000E59BF6E|nr:sensor histidine kinase [Taibaiella koreensis]